MRLGVLMFSAWLFLASAVAVAVEPTRNANVIATSPRRPTPLDDDAQLNDAAFVSTRHGWVVGDHGVIWHTDDAGETWTLQPVPTRSPLYSVSSLTDRVGWVAGGRTVPFARTGEGVLLRTTDGGETWQEVRAGTFPRLHFVKFFSPDEGIVAGEATATHPSGLLVTQDGGKTWRDVPARGEEVTSWRAADFVRPDRGAVVGRRGQARLIDSGGLFAPQRSEWGLRGLHDIVLKSSGLGWLVGDGGLVLRSTNSGLAWQAPSGELPEELRDLFDFRAVAVRTSTTSERVWLAGDPGSVIWHSADGGRTWERQRTGQTLPIRAITFVNDSVGWTVGAMGTILRTTNGGRTWESLRGGSRRAALVAFPTEPQRTSLPLVAQLGGESGYRSLTCVLARQDVGDGRRAVADIDVQLHEAVTEVGGSGSQIAWQLPITIPGLDRNTERLVADWNYRTEGRLSEVLVGQLVKLFRTWRPSVVVIDRPAEHDALTKLINQAITKATEDAADPTRFPDQLQIAGLATWSVDRIVQRLPLGSSGPVQVDPHQFLPYLGQTAGAASVSASGKLLDRPESSFARETYRVVVDRAPRKIYHPPAPKGQRAGITGGRAKDDFPTFVRRLLDPTNYPEGSGNSNPTIPALRDFFTNLNIPYGTDARRELASLRVFDIDRQQRLARQQRNMQAYLDRFLNDPRHAANLLSQTQDVVGQLPPEQAAWQLAQIAELHLRNGQWELAEITLTELIERHPDQPVSHRAMQRMIQAWIGIEPSWQRLRTSELGQHQIVGDPNSTARQLTQARAKLELQSPDADESPTGVEQASATSDPGSGGGVRIASAVQVTQARERTRLWWKLADRWAKYLKEHQPSLYATPQVQFPLAAMYRQRGQLGESETVFSLFGREGVTPTQNAWTRSAKAEQWIAHPVNLPPKSFTVCRTADAKPVLDGILSDPCWESADELPLTATSAERVTGSDHSFALLCRDREYLYFAASLVRHPAAPTDPPLRSPRSRDADLADFDRVSLVLDVDRDYATYYHLAVDQRGQTTDDCWGDPTWNPRWFVAVRADATHWRLEAAVPLSELSPQPPTRNEVWNIGITRTIPAVKQETWSHPATPTPQPETFGLVRFE
jgi:photosystem II stability/assembly factor-like uncharacterized protein